MEIALNLAWALCSLGLIWFWMRRGVSDRVSRRTQVLALAMVVLLLLPVISLSDDLVAAQGPAESDSCMRRASEKDHADLSLIPTALALPEFVISGHMPLLTVPEFLRADVEPPPSSFPVPSRFGRPPPQV
jgi:hypothetical protein